MPLYGLWSDKLDRWYVDGTGVIFHAANRSIAEAQLLSVKSTLAQQRAQAARENQARIAQYNAQRAAQSGFALPQILGRDGRPMPGNAVRKPLPPTSRDDGPQLIQVGDPAFRVDEITRSGRPKENPETKSEKQAAQ